MMMGASCVNIGLVLKLAAQRRVRLRSAWRMVPVYVVGMRADGAVAEAVGVVVDPSKISQIGCRLIQI